MFTPEGKTYDLEKQIKELNDHLEKELISRTLYNKLKIYFESGGSLDTEDWLFYIENKFEDERLLDISQLQRERNSSVDFNESQVVETLKQNGFFEYEAFSPPEGSRKILGKHFIKESVRLGARDRTKIIHFDLEGDVMNENNSYTIFLEEMEEFTRGIFSPTNIYENWTSSEGPIEVRFVCDKNEYRFNPSYYDDWYDLVQPMKLINGILQEKGFGIFTVTAEYTTGQDVLMIFLSESQRKSLQTELGWQLELLD